MNKKILSIITLIVSFQLTSQMTQPRSCPASVDNCSACFAGGEIASVCDMCAQGFARNLYNQCIKAEKLPTDKGFEHCVDLKYSPYDGFECYECKVGYFVTPSVSGCQKIEVKQGGMDEDPANYLAQYVQSGRKMQVKACHAPYYPAQYDDNVGVFRTCSNDQSGKPDAAVTKDCEIIGADTDFPEIYVCLQCKGDKIPIDGMCAAKPSIGANNYANCMYVSTVYDSAGQCSKCQHTHKNVKGECKPVTKGRLIV